MSRAASAVSKKVSPVAKAIGSAVVKAATSASQSVKKR